MSLILAADADLPFAVIATTFIGVATALATFFGRPYYWQAIDYAERDFTDKLRRMHINTANLRRNLVLWSMLLAIAFFGFWIFGESIIFAFLSVALLFSGPWYIIRRLAEKYRIKIEDQLSDSMVSMSSAIKAGLSLPQALSVLADQSPRPINREFGRIVGEYEMGKPLDKTLEEAKARLRSENFALFAAAVLASRESGGRLNETIDRIAHSVRELQRLERKITSETAMARRSSIYMALVPLFIIVLYYFVDPDAIVLLFTTPPGQLVLAIAIVFNIAAYLWARVILNPDI
jgi:tight adherence protein B